MLKINKKLEYALMSLKFISEHKSSGELTSVSEITNQLKIPFHTTSKVMQAMNSAGILKSVQGLNGGYLLDAPLNNVFYLELASIVDQKESESVCKTHKGLCDLYDHCNIINPIDRLNHSLNSYLSKLSIEDLFNMAFENKVNKSENPKEPRSNK